MTGVHEQESGKQGRREGSGRETGKRDGEPGRGMGVLHIPKLSVILCLSLWLTLNPGCWGRLQAT